MTSGQASVVTAIGVKQRSLIEDLRQQIESAEISRYELAKRTGISQSQLSRFVNGLSDLSLGNAELVCRELDLVIEKRGE